MTRTEDGTVLLLTLCYALIAMILVVVGVDAAAVFLAQRALASIADGAAVAGAQAVAEAAVYAGQPTSYLPLSATGVSRAVSGYLAQQPPDPPVTLLDADTDGTTVTVQLAADARLPFLGVVHLFTGAFPGGAVRLTVSASARSPLS